MAHNIVQGDILKWATEYDGEPFHALLCDPPYHLTEITNRFGKANAAPAQYGTDGAFQRASKGFMGQTWDGLDENGQGVAFRPETWAALARHLHPGAFGMAFASSRGWHRMAVAIEDAGLIIHPVIMCWAYGSGFPKATRLDTQIDRRAGAERPVRGQRKHAPKFAAAELGYREKDNGYNSRERQSFDETGPATDMARAWEGHRYGLQALKPALEPVIVFQKPYEGSPVDCITRTGAGAINIDGSRLNPGEMIKDGGRSWGGSTGVHDGWKRPGNQNYEPSESHSAGRWPANLALVHHPMCNGACHPDCTVARLGAQSGMTGGGSNNGRAPNAVYGAWDGGPAFQAYADTGTAARYFFNADWMYDRLEAADAVGYFAKASAAEREAGLDPLQVALMTELAGESFDETTVDDGRPTPIDNPYQRGETTRRNIHPTIKPLALARWLATLLLPPPEYGPRRLLNPFAGAASEAIGAMFAGWDEVQGVELDAEHVRIGRARLAYWRQRAGEFSGGREIRASAPPAAPTGQRGLFDEEAA